ncbi:MAG: hypothetical protein ACREI3_01190 [Nitrospirales bacterium]
MTPRDPTLILQGVDQATTRRWRAAVLVLACLALGSTPRGDHPSAVLAESELPKRPFLTCDTCPEGTARTGVTTDATNCKEGDHRLVQCVPLGAELLSVCGSCPSGYREIGSSNVPARCGAEDGGRMAQCQMPKLEQGLPDPSQGGVFCPPNCAGEMPAPGQGALPTPPQTLPPTPKEGEKTGE